MMIIERLSPHHDRRDFDCGVEELNSYLQRYSSQHERKGLGRTYVATKTSERGVLGYYTISSSAVAFDVVPENLPRHPVPVALIGRLAVDRSREAKGWEKRFSFMRCDLPCTQHRLLVFTRWSLMLWMNLPSAFTGSTGSTN